MMKLLGKAAAVLVAGVLSVLGVQLLVRRFYRNLGRDYVTIERDDAPY